MKYAIVSGYMGNPLDEVQILSLAKEGLSVGEIGESLGLQDETVKWVLARNGMSTGGEEIEDGDFDIIRNRLMDIAKHSENELVAARVGMFLYERKKGALKVANAPAVNIGVLNQLIQGASNFVDDFRKGKIIDENREPGRGKKGTEGEDAGKGDSSAAADNGGETEQQEN